MNTQHTPTQPCNCAAFDLLHAFALQVRELSTNGPGREVFGKMADEVLGALSEQAHPDPDPAKLNIASPARRPTGAA